MKKHKIAFINFIWMLILVVGIGTIGIFTAVQMGVFAKKPEIEIKAKYDKADAPTIKVATDYDFCPNSYFNSKNELSGLYIEVINEAANRLGKHPEFVTDDWPGCRAQLESGDVDVLLGLEIFSNMKGTLRTIPICSDELCVYGKNKVYSAAGLAGKKVALMARSVITSTFDLQCEYVEYYTNTEILEAVEKGEVDYGICHRAVSEQIIKKNGFHLKEGVAIMKSFPALAVKNSEPKLQKELNAVLKDMAEDGTLYKLKQKWIIDFTKEHSLSYVIKHNPVFYIVTVMSMIMLLGITFIFRINDKRREQYIATLLDYQEKLEISKKEAERANQVKSEFLSHMSHDIRTPMNGIMGMIGMIRKNINNPMKIEECLDKIGSVSNHLLSLINDVLDMSKLESGNIELENIPFSLSEECENICAIIGIQAQEKQVDFLLDDSEVEHYYLIGSPVHFRRILLNLSSNAVKYTPEKGKVRVYITELSGEESINPVSASIQPDKRRRAFFEIKVQDSGVGMSREFIENSLYKPFTQENDKVRTKYQGTGLGMAIVYELIKNMGGNIKVDSEPEKGTTFTVVLSFEISEKSDGILKKTAEKRDITGMRVLIAEDNLLNREIAVSILEEAGVDVVAVENGKQAVERFAGSPVGDFDAILMDIMMPVLDGLEAAREIRRMERRDATTVPIIAMTANAFVEDKKKSLEAGMNAHMTKPIDGKKLIDLLARFHE